MSGQARPSSPELADFCLGDTGAMAGHAPAPLTELLARPGGITTMLPTADAQWVGEELTRRFGVERWSFTLTATDANRWAIRIARQLTRRPKILVFSYCYHGSVDETFIVATPDGPRSRDGNVGAPVDPSVTTRVVEFNDVDALERELAHHDVAAVLMEPALTNIGIVLPAPGFLDSVRSLTRQYGLLLINDETHTFSAGPGGCTQAWGLSPDIVTIGKSIDGGIPAGAYGLSAWLSERLLSDKSADIVDVGGVGGTLAGNALSGPDSLARTSFCLSAVIDSRSAAGRPTSPPGASRCWRAGPAAELGASLGVLDDAIAALEAITRE